MYIPVLIVGAGPAGLTSAIVLSRLGVRTLLVERHPATSIHPKATAISTRTMELFRQWGIEPDVRERSLDVLFTNSVRHSLAEPELERRPLGFPDREAASVISPTMPAVLAQDILEPIMVEHARSYGICDLRFNTELSELSQHCNGVRATVVDRATGEYTEIHCRYLIAADGASSPIRQRLGIAMAGVERMGEYLSILFRADLRHLTGPEPCGLYTVQALGGPAPSVVVPTDRDGRWILATPWRSDIRPVPSLDRVQLTDLVRCAAGAPDLAVEVLDGQVVALGAQVAERFRDRNVFLVGDAAHRTTPTGGTGMNTAIHAAHNLAWKLAAVEHGWASPTLLDSYELERRPSGERNLLRSRGQLQGVSGVAADLGVVYASRAVVTSDDVPLSGVIEPAEGARVGGRAPHVWLDADGVRLSTLDLFDQGVVLLTGGGGSAWREAGRAAAAALGVPLGVVVIGDASLSDPSERWLELYGIDADGAVLVRPDGHIAWRSVGAAVDPTSTVIQVIVSMLGFSTDDRDARMAAASAELGRRCA